MFVRKQQNKTGSVSIQIISKDRGRYRVLKTIGCSSDAQGIESLFQQAKHQIALLQKQKALCISIEDAAIEGYLSNLCNTDIRVMGPELIFGKLYDSMGYSSIHELLFRHLVIARLAYPGSKLKTIDYLQRYQCIHLRTDSIYRFLDTRHHRLKTKIEQITFSHTLKLLKGKIGVVFYDLTTLHFEASDEDDLRKTGFSKEGRHQQPQIYLGLLVGLNGYPIGYDIFEGNIYEGHTLIPTLQHFEKKFHLSKPIVVADAGLLSEDNIVQLERYHYPYILGARINNEPDMIKKQILQLTLENGKHAVIKKQNRQRIIISYSDKRAAKDEHSRKRGLIRLEKNLKAGRLTKSHINNRGYNKYLTLLGKVQIQIDYNKFEEDKKWDGLKGYITNAKLSPNKIIAHYKNLWQIEKAFRISKTDLKIRPIYHRIRHRIEAHICIAFTAYAVYKELERILYQEKASISVGRAAELTHTMYQLSVTLPETKEQKNILLKMDKEQQLLYELVCKFS